MYVCTYVYNDCNATNQIIKYNIKKKKKKSMTKTNRHIFNYSRPPTFIHSFIHSFICIMDV